MQRKKKIKERRRNERVKGDEILTMKQTNLMNEINTVKQKTNLSHGEFVENIWFIMFEIIIRNQ